MSKTVKITVRCPKCGSLSAMPVAEDDIGKKKQGTCPKCRNKFNVTIPTSLAAKFDSDPTIGSTEEDISLLLETVPSSGTNFQTFELTADYYTIGRKNNSGPEHRPDIEVVSTNKTMSRKHAVIRKKGKVGFTIKDMGSKNGVAVNGSKLEPDEEMYLSDGDRFTLGDVAFCVSISERSDDYDDLTR